MFPKGAETMLYETHTVNVKDIAEYPTELGGRCRLLRYRKLDAYSNNEETLLDELTKSANDDDLLEICKTSGRCKAFWEEYQRGVTPFIDEDSIRLYEYGGRYWAVEGKHRVCMAMRTGVETIEARVWKLETDNFTLRPPIGTPGVYEFRFTCSKTRAGMRKIKGEIPMLWVAAGRDDEMWRFSNKAVPLDETKNTNGALFEVMSGVSYSVVTKPVGLKLFRRSVEVMVKVSISHNHANAKIWLMKACDSNPNYFSELNPPRLKTVFRFGYWRKGHRISAVDCIVD